MQCPYCTAVLPDDDLFCEECGKALKNAYAPLCLCGAPEGDLDEDGYCLQCGRRCRPAPGEHVEIESSGIFAAVSDRGLRHHRNEDRCRILEDSGRQILIVCDGVSTSSEAGTAAETASALLVQEIADGVDFAEAFAHSARAVAALSNAMVETAPSTTAVAALVEGHHVRIGWLGDSRAYWISKDGSRQLTMDHSWLNEVVSSGEMSYAEAVESPRAHGITRWMGGDAQAEISPEVIEFDAPQSGWLLLCTDGLWNYATDIRELEALVLSDGEHTALEIARRLVAFANERGGSDNITAALLGFTN